MQPHRSFTALFKIRRQERKAWASLRNLPLGCGVCLETIGANGEIGESIGDSSAERRKYRTIASTNTGCATNGAARDGAFSKHR